MLIPGGAFVGWTMVQTPTAFDAVNGVIGAVILGAMALALANKANFEQP